MSHLTYFTLVVVVVDYTSIYGMPIGCHLFTVKVHTKQGVHSAVNHGSRVQSLPLLF